MPVTLVAIWVRAPGPYRELIMASDSRVKAGPDYSDCNAKMLALSRPATAVAMSGDASEAYSFLLQILATSSLLDGHANGRTDLRGLADDLKPVLQDTRFRSYSEITRKRTEKPPTLDVVLAGWSWRRSRFEGYSYGFNDSGDVVKKSLRELDEQTAYGVYFAGSGAREALNRLHRILREEGLPRPKAGDPDARKKARTYFLDWQPLQILLDISADRTQTSIGGPPQILRMYQYGQTETFVWQDDNGVRYYAGRRLGDKERSDRRVLRWVSDRPEIRHSDSSIAATAQGWEAL